METKQQYGSNDCPMEQVVNLIGGKWKTVIMFHLLTKGTLRFSEIRNIATGITQKMLTAQLRALEADGLIIRKVYPVVPPKVEYSLSPLGKTLEPVLLAMKEWGNEHQVDANLTRELEGSRVQAG